MNIESVIKEYFDKRKASRKISQELKKIKVILRKNIIKILKLYRSKENEIYKKYDIFLEYEDYLIPRGNFDDFSIERETKNYILVNCLIYNYNESYISSQIKLPKNLDEIDLYVEKFGEELESNLIMNKLINN